MLLLRMTLHAAIIFSNPMLAIPLNSRALSPAPVPNVYLSSSQPSLSLGEIQSLSNSTRNLTAKVDKLDHEIDCFPRGSRLPDVNADDCKVIINHVILGMKDPLRVQSWGFTNAAEINLSLPEYKWTFKDCFMRVKNIDETKVDRFRPVDVAELAQRIVQKCVADTKERLGGNADIGQLSFPLSFYVVVSGTTRMSSESLRDSTIISLPSDGSRVLESRASLVRPEKTILPTVLTQGLKAGESYPVRCFDPSSVHRLHSAVASDCRFIINEIILRLPNPMTEYSFGYTDAVDINLSYRDNNRWNYGQCVVFIKNLDETSRDRFRFLDVAHTAHRIMERCVEGSKYAIGGTADIGTIEDNFYVAVGGIGRGELGNGTTLGLVSDAVDSSVKPASPMNLRTESVSSYSSKDTDFTNLDKRSNNTPDLLQTTNNLGPLVRCLRSGMPAARKIDIQDCTDAATVILGDPKILVPQFFTTEPTGGVQMPFVQHNKSCYLMMDTDLETSMSDKIPLLKMVYWALEIMLTCVSGREQGFGGVSKLDDNKGIFVSVTGVNPTYMKSGLASLSDESTSATNSEDAPFQIVDLGES